MANAESRLLIVDDDAQVCNALAAMVSSWGMVAKPLIDALLITTEVRETSYNLILLDVLMLAESGPNLLADLREVCPETRVIVMTGCADKDMAIEALQLGAIDFLEKPVTADLLLHAVTRALDTQEIERQHLHTLEELKQSQAALRTRTAELEQVKHELMETNDAIAVLARNIERTRQETEDRIVQNLRCLLMPLIEKLGRDVHREKYASELDMLVSYIEEMTSGFVNNQSIITCLSPSELRIATLIKHGMTSEAIAAHLHISPATVNTHRRNIRKKLRLSGKKNDLKSYLESLVRDAT